MNNTAIIIPARYNSSRFPGKPLALIDGVPMVLRVVERCLAAEVGLVYVATDDERIYEVVREHGGAQAILEKSGAPCGTDRIARAARFHAPYHSVYLNVQGDCPFIDPLAVRALADGMRDGSEAATLITDLASGDLENPHVVKALLNGGCQAVSFTRQVWSEGLWYRHIGAYAYRADVLQRFYTYGPAGEEQLRGLEQLRALQMGLTIKAVYTRSHCGPEINVPEDINEQ